MAVQDALAAISSIALRLAIYVFLRWIPAGGLPTAIYTLFALYVPSFIASFLTQSQYNVLLDEVDIVVQDVEVSDQPPALASTAAHSTNVPDSAKPLRIEEEVAIEETLVLEKRSAKPLRTLLTGMPSPTSASLSLLTLLINVALTLMATDFIYRGKALHPTEDLSFARLGYVSETHAKILVREPDESKWPVRIQTRIKDPRPPFDLTGWQPAGGFNYFSNDTDFTAALTFPLIRHGGGSETIYEYMTSNNHSGSFIQPAPIGKMLRMLDNKFTFLTSSCILPNFPYKPSNHPLSIPGFKHLAALLPSLKAQFMLFLGDFIYVDVPQRFGTGVEDYRREYREIYASPDWPAVGNNLSWIHVLDDHEIANDWDKNTTGLYQAAVDPWLHYQVSVNPDPATQAGTKEPRAGATYFEFTQGPATFFMMDTRRYRDKEDSLPANSTAKSMLGRDQLADLLAFLDRPVKAGVQWKIVASSVPFTKNWRSKLASSMDTWAGYLAERQTILEAMWDASTSQHVGVVVLSGDRHEFAATAFPPPLGGRWPVSATVNEFSTSPLSQFYLPIQTYSQVDDEDIMIKYIPQGNSKFGAVTISNEASDQSMLKFRLFVDGEEAWSAVLLSPPRTVGLRDKFRDALWGQTVFS